MQNLLANDKYLYNPGAKTVLKDAITLYCVRYDPFYCNADPERLWTIVQRSGGSVHAGAANCLDFYVPERIIAQVMLMDSGLRIQHAKSYI